MSKNNSAENMLSFEAEQGSNLALQVALQTMKERCQQLEKRLTSVEEENLNLRKKCALNERSFLALDDEKSEIDQLRDKIAQLGKQKSQLMHNVFMVANENRQLWQRLMKLTHTNQKLGNHLSKINDTLKQHSPSKFVDSVTHSNLIRSQTFTQTSPHMKIKPKNDVTVEENNVSLEEISLKVLDNLMKEKFDLEKQYAQMLELHCDDEFDSSTVGFAYLDEDIDVEEESLKDLTFYIKKMDEFKESLKLQQSRLKSALHNLKKISIGICKSCQEKSKENAMSKVNHTSLETENQDILGHKVNVTSSMTDKKQYLCVESDTKMKSAVKICPMCNKKFTQTFSFKDFTTHVENHFTGEDDSITDHYEIVTTLRS